MVLDILLYYYFGMYLSIATSVLLSMLCQCVVAEQRDSEHVDLHHKFRRQCIAALCFCVSHKYGYQVNLRTLCALSF